MGIGRAFHSLSNAFLCHVDHVTMGACRVSMSHVLWAFALDSLAPAVLRNSLVAALRVSCDFDNLMFVKDSPCLLFACSFLFAEVFRGHHGF